jgi:hypothetical protein
MRTFVQPEGGIMSPKDDDVTKPRESRLSWPAVAAIASILAAVGTLVGGLAAAGVFGSGGGAPKISQAATTPTSTVSSTATVTPAQKLLEHIPSEVRGSCRGDSNPPSTAIASETCVAGSLGSAEVGYSLFPDRAAMSTYFDPRYNGWTATGKSCGEDKVAKTVYHDGAGAPGELLCYTYQQRHWIEWTNTRQAIYSYIGSSLPFSQVFAWWQNHAGPT